MLKKRLGQTGNFEHIDQQKEQAIIQCTNRKPLDSPDDANMCHTCINIDLRAIFQLDLDRTLYKIGGVAVARFPQTDIAWESVACSLCRFFAAVRVRIREVAEERNSCYYVRAFPFLKWVAEVASNAPKNLKATDIVCLAVLPGKDWSFDHEILNEPYLMSGEFHGAICAVDLLDSELSEPDMSTKFGVRMLQPDYVDYRLLRAWVDVCQDSHEVTCKIDDQIYSHLKVIDCSEKTIVRLPPSCEYLALSYVWGAQGHDEDFNVVPADSANMDGLPKSLPTVIKDAIIATQELGWRYLWVDRYCIDQDNEQDKHELIAGMDRIYACAAVTLIAAAGRDAHFGLPGVGATPRKLQPQMRMHGITMASTLAHSETLIEKSVWATRGWTYQEAMLSIRRLVFTEEQVYYECKSMYCCESIRTPRALLSERNGTAGSQRNVRRGYFERHRALFAEGPSADRQRHAMIDLRQHLVQYTARKLSHPSDSLNGFMGILNQYKGGPQPINHHLGLPVYCLSAKANVNYPSFFSTLVQSQYVRSLVLSLLWEYDNSKNEQIPHRIRNFPSYTWAGWTGIVNLRYTKADHLNFVSDVVVLSDSYGLQQLLLHQTTPHIHGHIEQAKNYLDVEANTAQIQLHHVSPDYHPPNSFYGKPEGFRIQTSRPEFPRMRGNVNLSTVPAKGEDFFNRLQNQPTDCLIMGQEGHDRLLLLLIEWHNGIAERIGTAEGGLDLAQFLETDPSAHLKRRKVRLG